MKKILCLILAFLILCPILLLSASAAEPEEYVFEYVEPVMTLGDDYDFSYGDDESITSKYNYFGHLPDGKYMARLVDVSGNIYFSPAFVVSFPGWGPGLSIYSKFYTTPKLEGFDVPSVYWFAPFFRLRYYRETGYDDFAYITCFYFTFGEPGSGTYSSYGSPPDGFSITLIRIPPPALGTVSNVISENPIAVFSYIISLLPVVLPVLVGFLGIRKTVEFVMDKFKKA